MGNYHPQVRSFARLKIDHTLSSRTEDALFVYEKLWFEAMSVHTESLQPALGTLMVESPSSYPAAELQSSYITQQKGITYVVMTFRRPRVQSTAGTAGFVWAESIRRDLTVNSNGQRSGRRIFYTDSADPAAMVATKLSPRSLWPSDTGDYPLTLASWSLQHDLSNYTTVVVTYDTTVRLVQSVSDDGFYDLFQQQYTILAETADANVPVTGAALGVPVSSFDALLVSRQIVTQGVGSFHADVSLAYRRPRISTWS
jgi:hypothetical protein